MAFVMVNLSKPMPRRTEPTALTAKLGARIYTLRRTRDLSLGDLEISTGLLRGHLSNMERGLAAITVDTVERVAWGLRVLPLYLFAFPEDNEAARVMDVLRDMPSREVRRLRVELAAKLKAARNKGARLPMRKKRTGEREPLA